jgi:hypothetical protein
MFLDQVECKLVNADKPPDRLVNDLKPELPAASRSSRWSQLMPGPSAHPLPGDPIYSRIVKTEAQEDTVAPQYAADFISDLAREEFDGLVRHTAERSVSVYLPTRQVGPDAMQGRVRLKNLLALAEERLIGEGMRRPEATRLLGPATRLLDDKPLWQHQGDGLALFIAPSVFHHYRLPRRVADLVVVGDRFHILPLLPLFTDDGRFLVLALSENDARLFECTRLSVHEVKVPGLPAGVKEALGYDALYKERSAHESGRGGPGTREITHGQGIGGEVQKERLGRYLLAVDQALRGRLASESAPLVLAGVDAIRASYEGITAYPHVLKAGIHGSPDRMSAEQLHRLGWSLVEPGFAEDRTQAVADFRRVDGTGLASAQPTEVLAAAEEGRVAVLLVLEEPQAWEARADLSAVSGQEEVPEPSQRDVLNDAAIHVVRSGGRVYVLTPEEMPDGAPAAALFRY